MSGCDRCEDKRLLLEIMRARVLKLKREVDEVFDVLNKCRYVDGYK